MIDKKPKNRKQSISKTIELSPAKKRLNWIITLSLPFLIIILSEVCLRFFNYGSDTTLFVSTPSEDSKYYGINLNVAKRYFTTLSDVPTPRKDLFLKEKPKNGYRIFVLGESTAAGFPYGNNVTFPRILNRRLSDAFPNKRIEVVNTAMTAINSYAQLDFMEEILKYQPDAILIYAGHNEFYGALGIGSMESFGKYRWMVKVTLTLQKFKIYLLMRDVITGIKSWLSSGTSVDELSDPTATLMERIVNNKIIPLNSEDYELGKNQFKENIREIIQMAQNAGVKVLISELVSNIYNNRPFESVKSDKFPPAQQVYDQALVYEKEGKIVEAKRAFYLAKDLDALRFRAPEDFNSIIHNIADECKVPVIPMKSYFEAESPHQIIGNNLMHEHLHPNIDGYFLMADAFFNTMRNSKLISDGWPEKNIKSSSYYRNNWGFTPLDSVYAFLSVAQLKGGWPFKKVHGPNLTLLNFKPSNKIDSVAINIMTTGQSTLELGHIELANYYGSKDQLELAFKEYEALIYTVPYLDLFYEPAVKVLMQMQMYDKALNVLFESLKYNQTAFAYQWIGQIYLVNNETPKGITFLNKALELGSQDLAMLFNLGRAYYKTSQFKQGDAILNQLKNKSAQSYFIPNLEEFRKTSVDNFKKASEYIKEAQSNLRIKDFKKAYTFLQQSLLIQETSAAYELIGMIDLVSGSKTESLENLEKAYAISPEKNPKLLYNLSNAYYANAQYDKAKIIFAQLKKSYPDFSDPVNLESKLSKVNNSLIN